MGKSTKDSKKRSRAAEEDVNAIAIKKSKLDESGNAEVTKVETEAAPKVKKDKKEKKEKKSKKSDTDAAEEPKKEKKEKKDKKKDKKGKATAATTEESAPAAEESTDKKSKKEKKKDKKNKNKTEETTTEETTAEETKDEEEQTQQNGAKGARFIIFVGNMPYSVTADQIKEHFASVHPISVRLLTHRDNPTKSKGTAFVEFGRFDHMKTALEKFHHSEMLDDKGVARKINVELRLVLFASRPSPLFTYPLHLCCPPSPSQSASLPPIYLVLQHNTDRELKTAPAEEAKPPTAKTKSRRRTASSTRSV